MLHFIFVDLEKGYICKEWLLVVNWVQIPNQNPAAIADTGLSCTLHFRKKPRLSCQPPTHVPVVWVNPFKKAPDFLKRKLLVFPPIGLGSAQSNQNCIVISSFACLLIKQSSFIRTNQNVQFWPIWRVLFGPISLYEFGLLIYITMNQSGTTAGTFSIKRSFSLVSAEHTFSFLWRLYLPSLQTVNLNKVSPFTEPQT